MKRMLLVAAIAEAATGAALLVAPSVVGRLLLGEELTGAAIPVARVLGISLVALGLACRTGRTGLAGMLTYSSAVALYLAYLGLSGASAVLLWPAVAAHAAMSAGLFVSLRDPQSESDPRP